MEKYKLLNHCTSILLIAFFLGRLTLDALAQPKQFTQNQMLEDIDSLQSKIYNYCSYLPLLEQRTNISISTIFERLRQKITSHTSTADFTDIVWQHLNILQDGHSKNVNSSRVKWVASSNYYLAPVGNIALSDTIHADYYFSLTTDSIYSAAKSGIRAKYINGKYYNMRPFTFNQTPVKLGDEITAVNGVDINYFIQEYCTQIYALRWGVKNVGFQFLKIRSKNVITTLMSC